MIINRYLKKLLNITLVLLFIFLLQACNNHPKDKTGIDDIYHCGFGQEYVSGYTKSNGTEVSGYCRDKN